MSEMDSTLSDGTQEANPAASPAAVQPSSFDPEKFAKTLKAEILAAIRDPKEVQSLKDRTIAEIKKDKGLKEVWAEIKAMQADGLSEKDIEREIRLRELESRNAPEAPAPVTQSAGRVVEQPANDPVKALISSLNLNENDPEVTTALLNTNFAEKVSQLAGLAQRKKQTTTPALVAQPSGSGVPDKMSDSEVEAKSAKLSLLYRSPTANAIEIKKLEAELAQTWV